MVIRREAEAALAGQVGDVMWGTELYWMSIAVRLVGGINLMGLDSLHEEVHGIIECVSPFRLRRCSFF